MNIELLKDIMYPVILTYNGEQLKTAKKSQPLEGY